MAQPANDFFEIKDQALIAKILDVCQRHKVPINFWLKNQVLKFETTIHYYFQHKKGLTISIPADVGQDKMKEAFESQKSNEVFASLILDAVNFFFKTEFVDFPKPGLFHVQAPKSVFKLQRRQNLRIPFPRRLAPKLTLLDPDKVKHEPAAPINEKDYLAFRIIDVSAGGLGIAAPIEMQSKLKIGTPLRDMRFSVRGMEIHTEGLVQFVSETESDKGQPMLRIGLKFTKLNAQYEKHIVQFVLDESRKMFTLLSR